MIVLLDAYFPQDDIWFHCVNDQIVTYQIAFSQNTESPKPDFTVDEHYNYIDKVSKFIH
jgi:hypothetical protein